MSLPYHRGQVTTNMNNRAGMGWGTRDQRVEEANRTLMEQENDRKWVRDHVLFPRSLHFLSEFLMYQADVLCFSVSITDVPAVSCV